MPNNYFQFKQFTIHQDKSAMKVTTDACLFGAACASLIQEERLNVLDIGTGTGLLSLMLAQANQTAIIDSIEIDEQAAIQAKENITASPWADRVSTIHADIKNFEPARSYAIIISNPPFYENELKSADSSKNKAHHDEGLLLTELLAIIKQRLAPGGRFYLLLPYKRKGDAELLCRNYQLAIRQCIYIRQSVHHDYFRVIIEGSHAGNTDQSMKETELSIRDKDNQYTPGFINLLGDYYLYL